MFIFWHQCHAFFAIFSEIAHIKQDHSRVCHYLIWHLVFYPDFNQGETTRAGGVLCGLAAWAANSSRAYTLNRKSLTCFVRTKPRGSVVIRKPLPLRRSLCARKASWLYHMTLYYSHIIVRLNHVCWITLSYQGDSIPLVFPLWRQMDHNLPCLRRNLLTDNVFFC